MSAFKAANPDAVFEDFIRWHSPGDWENDGSEANDEWPPRGKLSQRMSGPGNSWRKIWNDAPSLPAYEQKPLLDPNREGEKVSFFSPQFDFYQEYTDIPCGSFDQKDKCHVQRNYLTNMWT